MKQQNAILAVDAPGDRRAAPAAAMDDPQPGDRYTEMYKFYLYVLAREGNMVTFMEVNPPCRIPHDGKVGRLPTDEFPKRYAYGSIPGYWVSLLDRGYDVTGWEAAAHYRISQ